MYQYYCCVGSHHEYVLSNNNNKNTDCVCRFTYRQWHCWARVVFDRVFGSVRCNSTHGVNSFSLPLPLGKKKKERKAMARTSTAWQRARARRIAFTVRCGETGRAAACPSLALGPPSERRGREGRARGVRKASRGCTDGLAWRAPVRRDMPAVVACFPLRVVRCTTTSPSFFSLFKIVTS
jgi:hypothetical protein